MADKKNQEVPQEENLSQLLQIRRDKLKELQESGNDPFQITRYEVDNDSANIKANFDALEGQAVSVAGRLMSKRGMGKVSFCDLQDKSGRIQLYARRDEMDEAEYARFKKFDIGDIVGVKGVVFRTQRGEMSVRVERVTLLSKSLLPLPETFHGLAGVGDLIATCGSPLSRNYTFGFNLGKGMSVAEATKASDGVAEGVATASAVVELGEKYHVDTPLAKAVTRVLDDGISFSQMVSEMFPQGITVE